MLHTIERINIWMTIFRDSRRVFKNYLTVLLKYAVYKRLTSLKTIRVKCIADEGVLKIDCEGCEYAVFAGAPISVLKRFKEIVIEYHGSPRPLVKKLVDAGFRAAVMPPWTVMDGLPVGFIHAER